MATYVLCVLFALPPTVNAQLESNTNADTTNKLARRVGGLSHFLNLTLKFVDQPKAHFEVVLTNVSDKNLALRARFDRFHGTLRVQETDGTTTELFMPTYRNMVMTSFWLEPLEHLPAQSTHKWKLPLTVLVDLHGEPAQLEELRGKRISAQIQRIGVVPQSGRFTDRNAEQRSNVISIPDRG